MYICQILKLIINMEDGKKSEDDKTLILDFSDFYANSINNKEDNDLDNSLLSSIKDNEDNDLFTPEENENVNGKKLIKELNDNLNQESKDLETEFLKFKKDILCKLSTNFTEEKDNQIQLVKPKNERDFLVKKRTRK